MIIEYKTQGQNHLFDLQKRIDISIPIGPNQGVIAFGVDAPQFKFFKAGNYEGAVQKGAGSNCETIFFTPHGNGTHTECYGHIHSERVCVNDCFEAKYRLGLLISIEPSTMLNGDQIIRVEEVINAYKAFNTSSEVLIIRTKPNNPSKKTKNYTQTNPPYLHWNVAKWMADQKIEHLIIDLPSIDRENDHGEMLAHKAFWQYPDAIRTKASITELVYLPDAIQDGIYLVDIQIAAFQSDASPSRPILYPEL